MASETDVPLDPIAELLVTYNELNSSVITELQSEPSPLEFLRYVALNRPFVVRNGLRDWRATGLWSKDYLLENMGKKIVNVAVTPQGFVMRTSHLINVKGTDFARNADAVVSQDRKDIFVKPLEECQPFETLVDYVSSQELESKPGEVWYAQTRKST
jgi:jumonji domain-containing protein 7